MKPVVHLFHLGVSLENRSVFHEAGVFNLIRSQKNEPETLAMYASQVKNSPTEFIVFEVYANEEAYQTHRDSPQYQAYVEKVGSKLTKRESFEVEPVFMQERIGPGEWVGEEYFYLKFAQVETKVGSEKAFETSVLTSMKTSLAVEEGLLAMYAMRECESPNRWYFYEVYANERAYQLHRETSHFKTYLAETEALLLDKQLEDLVNDVAVTKGSLNF